MDPSLMLQVPPPLDPAWLQYETTHPQSPPVLDVYESKKNYILRGLAQNEKLLSSTLSHLADGLSVTDTTLTLTTHPLHYRTYKPISPPSSTETHPTIIYLHGGGLYVGDLNSEDLSCRRISKDLQSTVYSCDYRLLPDHSPDDALSDCLALFNHLLNNVIKGPFVLVGSSSGGQLAAQLSQNWLHSSDKPTSSNLVGVCLRCPVTCNASSAGKYLPERYKHKHHSLNPAFHTSLIKETCITEKIRTANKLPLEEERLEGLPRHWMQVTTNDIFYSDGVCYADALKKEGVECKVQVEWGWPHTFWLKAQGMKEGIEAEEKMVEGLRWLAEGV